MVGRLDRAGLRYLIRHPWQTWLSVLGIALGVAVVVAVDLANDSARRAFRLSMESLTGRATHQIIGAPPGFDEAAYPRLRVDQGVRPSAPVIEGVGVIAGETFNLLGVDPFAEGPFRETTAGLRRGTLARLLSEPRTLLMAAVSAERLNLKAGDRVSLEVAGRGVEAEIIGLIEHENAAAIDGLLVADIATAQELLGRPGVLDRIDLITEDPQAVRGLLPEGLRLEPAAGRTNALARMSDAFHTNLAAMSLLALLVGAFLIYNTMTFSVLQRRELLGTLRTLGATRRELFSRVLLEALAVGLGGGLLGLLLGVAMAQGLVSLVSRTINDLYFVVTVNRLFLDPWLLLKGLALGALATLAAAAGPAWEAARTEPSAVLRRSDLEHRSHRALPWLAGAGVAALAAGGALLWAPGRSLIVGLAALFMIIVGFALLVPALTLVITRAVTPLLGLAAGSLGRMAARGIGAGLSRTGLAVAALTVAVSASVGVAIMIHSFRGAVQDWLSQTLRSDIYVSAPGGGSHRMSPALAPAVPGILAGLPQVEELSTGRRVRVDGPRGPVDLLAIDMASGSLRGFRFIGTPADDVWEAFRDGEAILASEPYAWRNRIAVGDRVRLRTVRGPRSFRVAGVFRDYASDQGRLVMDRGAYARLWGDPAVSTVGLFLAPGADAGAAAEAVRETLAGVDEPVEVRSNRAIREESLAIFDRTFTITEVLRILAVGVAFIGVLSALLALQLERVREHALLRATGATPAQVLGLVGLQTGLMGLIAGLLALPLGWIMAEILIHVVNRRSFGWSMATRVPPEVLWQAVALALAAALVAGLYPALRVARTSPARALREE
ncbi:MAG: FtsX-like permease family protein [Chromatiales bacterium]|jgi:putative ABC transport system permease protein